MSQPVVIISPTTAPSAIPSFNPSAQQSVAPTIKIEENGMPSGIPSIIVSEMPTIGVSASLQDFLSQTLTSDQLLATEGTPQNRALRLLSTTNAELNPEDPIDQLEIVERYVLNTIYFSTEGGSWTDSTSWTEASHPCGGDTTAAWYGLSCDESGTQVEGIDLNANNLGGTLTSEIRGLVGLSKCNHH
jgi:hypothetical protein